MSPNFTPLLYVGTHHEMIRPSLKLVMDTVSDQISRVSQAPSGSTEIHHEPVRESLEAVLHSVIEELLLIGKKPDELVAKVNESMFRVCDENLVELANTRMAQHERLMKESDERVAEQDWDDHSGRGNEINNLNIWIEHIDQQAKVISTAALSVLRLVDYMNDLKSMEPISTEEAVDVLLRRYPFEAGTDEIDEGRYRRILRHLLALGRFKDGAD